VNAHNHPEPEAPTPVLSDLTRRYWSDPVFAAEQDAERDAVLAAYWGPIDARRRADQEAMWAADIQPTLEA